MKTTTALFLVFFGFLSLTQSQWVSNFGGFAQGDINFDNAKGNAITSDNSGNCYITGYSLENSTGNDIVTIKYNSEGTMVWAKGYDGTAHADDAGNGICVDQYGNVYVIGQSFNDSRNIDLTLIKYDANGYEVWDKIYGVTEGNYEDKGFGITVDEDCNIYVTGYTTNTDGYTDIVTQKYDANGNVAWTELEDGAGSGLNGEGLSIKVSASGNVFVAGYTNSGVSGSDIMVIKYNSGGAVQWTQTINGSGNAEDKAWGIVTDLEDNAYITGYITNSTEGFNTLTAKLDTDGNIIWQDSFNGEGNAADKAWGIVTELDGSLYITGETYTVNGGTDYVTIKYNSDGDLIWSQIYDGTGSGEDVASSICIVTETSGVKKVVVTGKSWGTNDNYDYATVRYSPTSGDQLQVNLYAMTNQTDDVANDITTSDSKVYITGFSELIVDGPGGASVISTQSLEMGERSELVSNNNTPKEFRLFQNYPNPFNPGTSITFEIPESGNVKLIIYDVLGKQVAVLVNNILKAGTHNISYSNSNLASGIYFYELRSGSHRDIKKMNLIK